MNFTTTREYPPRVTTSVDTTSLERSGATHVPADIGSPSARKRAHEVSLAVKRLRIDFGIVYRSGRTSGTIALAFAARDKSCHLPPVLILLLFFALVKFLLTPTHEVCLRFYDVHYTRVPLWVVVQTACRVPNHRSDFLSAPSLLSVVRGWDTPPVYRGTPLKKALQEPEVGNVLARVVCNTLILVRLTTSIISESGMILLAFV